jgi:flagellar FliL protein
VAGQRTSSASNKNDASAQAPLAQTVMVLVALTLTGAGGGAFLGMSLGQGSPASSGRSPGEMLRETNGGANGVDEKQHGLADGHGGGGSAASLEAVRAPGQSKMQLKELPPVITNLGTPETSWVRLQASIVYDVKAVPQPDLLVTELMSDLVAFLRTISLASIEGPEGLRRLHEDLSERAAIRSEGRVREFIIQALVIQ